MASAADTDLLDAVVDLEERVAVEERTLERCLGDAIGRNRAGIVFVLLSIWVNGVCILCSSFCSRERESI